jgi:hypothetical protein
LPEIKNKNAKNFYEYLDFELPNKRTLNITNLTRLSYYYEELDKVDGNE